MKRCIVIVLLFFCTIGFSFGQSINDLRKQKSSTIKQINYTSKLLKSTARSARQSVSKLSLLKKQIELRNQLINDLNGELSILEQMIANNQFLVDALSDDLIQIRSEYAAMIRQAQRNRNTYNKLLFILSADDFNQAYKRMLYLKQYTGLRKRQIEQIDAVNQVLKGRVQALEKQQAEKETLVGLKQDENNKLSLEKLDQSQLLSKLKKKQRGLKQKLGKQQRAARKLEKEIQRLIAEEIRKSKLKGKRELTAEQKALAGDFSGNKGRLPWPVAKGVVIDKFGEHTHPVLKHVKIKNNGIDIATSSNQKARSIFKGTVSRVIAIPGANLAVIIQHGSFLTVYSNLTNVVVKRGDKVDTKQVIGSIYTDQSGTGKTILKFQVWKDNVKLNPEHWIHK
ncbi:hypothetical protein EMN47_07200 [Prolixibacteraceae bacterium JC049]|nr:hypothetical protein [Prolixibacteraceae bacterium JC049]